MANNYNKLSKTAKSFLDFEAREEKEQRGLLEDHGMEEEMGEYFKVSHHNLQILQFTTCK